MDFEFTEEQKMFRDALREFLERKYGPIVDKRDREGPFTKEEAIRVLKDFREVGIGYDPESAKHYLGDTMFFGIASEEISRVWASLNGVLGLSFTAMFVSIASDETRERWLPKLEKSEIIGGYAVTEPEAVCDTRNLRTTAVLEGDQYVINGQKTWISNAPILDMVLIVAVEKETGMQNLFFVDKERVKSVGMPCQPGRYSLEIVVFQKSIA